MLCPGRFILDESVYDKFNGGRSIYIFCHRTALSRGFQIFFCSKCHALITEGFGMSKLPFESIFACFGQLKGTRGITPIFNFSTGLDTLGQKNDPGQFVLEGTKY